MIERHREVLHNLRVDGVEHVRKSLNTNVIAAALGKELGVCDNLIPTARESLILNGEMAEWLKEHAWKAIS